MLGGSTKRVNALVLGIRRGSSYAQTVTRLHELLQGLSVRRSGRGGELVPKSAIARFASDYLSLDGASRQKLLEELSKAFTPSLQQVEAACDRYITAAATSSQHALLSTQAQQLRHDITPPYETLFRRIAAESGRGVGFVVDVRDDVLKAQRASHSLSSKPSPHLMALDASLLNMLQSWFGAGFLELQRISFEATTGSVLEKIALYEAVHPISSINELKDRLGHGRRCFAFFHPNLPGEPLIFVHVALVPELPGNMKYIHDNTGTAGDEGLARCAVFYSISASKGGLRGVQLGDSLIQRVCHELKAELPQLSTTATLSPIPKFVSWLCSKVDQQLRLLEQGSVHLSLPLLTEGEMMALTQVLQREASSGLLKWLKTTLEDGTVLTLDDDVQQVLELILVRLAARYLVREQHRRRCPCPVANFHLSNGAKIWRINWGGDTSSKGVAQSASIMVNYSYVEEDTEDNSRKYLGAGAVQVSDGVQELLDNCTD
ncbi:unnamed protein product [Chrysoparadoxa australica]